MMPLCFLADLAISGCRVSGGSSVHLFSFHFGVGLLALSTDNAPHAAHTELRCLNTCHSVFISNGLESLTDLKYLLFFITFLLVKTCMFEFQRGSIALHTSL